MKYKKPAKRPEPKFKFPVDEKDIDPGMGPDIDIAKKEEWVFHLLHSGYFHEKREDSSLPWDTFHAALSGKSKLALSAIAFNPIIMANPTDPSTIYTTLLRSKEAVNVLGHDHVPVFFDMGLLMKALEIIWSQEDLSSIIPCEGGMHLLMSVISGIGYLYGDAGLKQLLYESDVYAAGTVDRMMSGKDFDRGLRGLKLVHEVLMDRFLMQFQAWNARNGRSGNEIMRESLESLDRILIDVHDTNGIQENLQNVSSTMDEHIQPHIEEFRSEGRAKSSTFRFWDDFLFKVMFPFMLFLKASRVGNWTVYQSSKASLLPLLFATGRSNYAKYMCVMLLLMKQLPQEVESAFEEGLFVAKLTEGHFNAVWLDYALETTENKALKGTGGIIGLTMRGDALARWFMARPVSAKYSMEFHNSCQESPEKGKEKTIHHTASNANRKRWNEDLQKMKTMFDAAGYIDPFDLAKAPKRLVNIATGTMPTEEVEGSLISAIDKGKSLAHKFVHNRLACETKTKSFYDPVPRCQTKTMSSGTKTVKVKSKEVIMEGEIMYLRLLAVNSKKQVPLERVLAFENTPTPLSMFDNTGTMLSGVKSDFMAKAEGLINDDKIRRVQSEPVVYDGHALIQMIQGPTGEKTFKDMAENFTACVIKGVVSKDAKEIHVVFDKYYEKSVKAMTRSQRSGGCNRAPVHHIQLDGKCPNDWKAFLQRDENKSALATCYTQYMIEKAGELLHEEQTLVLCGGQGDIVVKVMHNSWSVIESLTSNQEEADTRIVLHAAFAAKQGLDIITVVSPDTDVLVLLTFHQREIGCKELYLYTGREGKYTDQKRYIPIHVLSQKFTQQQQNILLAVYCITGCDTVSTFYGYGKKTAFRLLMKDANKYQALSLLGSTTELTKEGLAGATAFVEALYGKSCCTCLNSLRVEMSQKRKKLLVKKLPPTDDSFKLHVLRTIFQLHTWNTALCPIQENLDPLEYGFSLDTSTNQMHPTLMGQSPAAPELLNDLVCSCSSGQCHILCCCLENDQPCTKACECEGSILCDDATDMCTNLLTMSVLVEESEDFA